MSREYKVDKEYSFIEIVQYNLRMWWLAVIMALLCAAMLGGYKYVSLRPYVEKEVYENKQQAVGSLFVSDYSDTSVVERANNVIKIASSRRSYEQFCKNIGMQITIEEYNSLFVMQQGEASGVVSVYVTYPANCGNITIEDAETAMVFAQEVMNAAVKVCNDVIGVEGVSILDTPYVTEEVVKIENYSISEDDFERGVMKGIAAGVVLGVIVEVVLFTFWMLIYKKPKNAEEVRQCLDCNIIDVLKMGEDNEDGFKKVAFYLNDAEMPCNVINCIALGCPKKDTALKLAMSYANAQKKTLYVDLSANDGTVNETNSISRYVLGETESVQPLEMNEYLYAVCRTRVAENGMDIVGNKRFEEFISEMKKQYECIVIHTGDVEKTSEAYVVSNICDKTFVACGRKNVKNETLYRAKNIADVNEIHIDGVLIYEL